MRYKVIYIIFLVSIIFYANFRVVGPFSLRHILAILMFIVCVFEDKKLFIDRYSGLFFFFVFCFGISSLFTGYFSRFPRYLIGFVFVAYVAYWASTILVRKFNARSVFINTLVISGIIDVLVTVGQFWGIDVFNRIPELLRISVSSDILEFIDEGEELLGVSLPGLFLSSVYNGYFILVAAVLSLFYQKNGFSVIRLIPWLLAMVGLYVTQQRGPFFIAVAFSIYILYRVIGKEKKAWTPIFQFVFLLFVAVGISLFISMALSGSSRFALGIDDTNRSNIYHNALAYIENHLFLGGYYRLRATEGFAPHNLLLNAWIYGGLLGFIAILVMTIWQFLSVGRVALSKKQLVDYGNYLVGLAFIAFTLNSMLHNTSVVTGDAIVWALWGCFQANKIQK